MKRKNAVSYMLTGCFVFPGAAFCAETDGASVFSPLTITDEAQAEANHPGSSSETYTRPGAYSSRTLNENLQNLDSSLRSMAGSYTQLDPLQGTVDVNIRGMSGLGRVNTMVDGVTQTFYSMAPSSYHFGPQSSSGVLIDPNFLTGVDVTRGSSAGSQGVNALMGSANMHTIGIDDVVKEGRQTGLLSRFSVGNNGLGRTGMVAVAGKTDPFANGGMLGALVGISGNRTYGSYKNGDGDSSRDFIGEDTKYLRQEPRSQLYKLDFNPDQYNRIEFSGRNYRNTITRRDITSDDYSLRYNYAPLSELIDFNVLASTSRGNQTYEEDSIYSFYHASTTNKSNALDISNTSRFSYADVDVEFLIGGKLMDTRYTRGFYQDEDHATGRNAFVPSGKQNISSLYTGLTLKKDIYQLDMDLNYTRSQVKGFKPACAAKERCFPQGEANLDLDDKAVNPSVTLSAQVTPWLQPFVGWSRSSRAPNVQEVFFSNEGGASMNPFLKPEKSNTWQAGFNINKEGLLDEKDSFHLKALAYESRIKNYINSESFFLCYDGSLCKDIVNSDSGFNANVYVNTPSVVTTHGYEIEAGYDIGYAYVNVTLSQQHTNQPTSIASSSTSFAYDDMSDLPERYATLDIGGRLLNQNLVIGTLVKFTGKTKRMSTWPNIDTNTMDKEDMPNIPTIIDLYSSYQVTDDVKLRLGVQNLTNKNYADALNRFNQNDPENEGESTVNTTARGRTWVFGGEVRF